MSCALCKQTIGRVRIYDAVRRLFFCSQNCVYRYLGILALWEEILNAE